MNNSYSYADAHLKGLHLNLGQLMENKVKIYLDTKYWLFLRDAFMGQPRIPAHEKLLNLLLDGKTKEMIVCPVYLPTFLEIARQNDYETLKKSTELIDILSDGICLKYVEERIGTEISYFFRTNIRGIDSCYPQHLLAWTKIFHVLGVLIPYQPLFDEQTNRTIQTGYLDHVWSFKFGDMLQQLNQGDFYTFFGAERFELADKLNKGKFTYAEELTSFSQAILTEIGGFLDTLTPMLTDIALQMYRTDTGNSASDEEVRNVNPAKLWANAIYNAFKYDKVGKNLPTIRIEATLHAAMRWDRNRKMKNNDFLDIYHASGALPYCDVFLTEKSLCSLITRSDIIAVRLRGKKKVQNLCNVWYKKLPQHLATQGDFGREPP